jgi:multidrug efflux pump subunit AcrA (membrane-fusion protein)
MIAAQKLHSSEGIRLTSQRIQEVLDASVEACLGAGKDELLSQFFLEGLRRSSGAVAIRIWEVWKTTVRLAGSAGAAPAGGVTEKALRLRLMEPNAGLREHCADELQPQQTNSAASGGNWRFFTVTAELASELQLLLEFCFQSPVVLIECAENAAEIYADLRRRELVLQQRRFFERFGVMELLIQRLHEATEKSELLRILATEGAAVLGCYRVSVCERYEGRWRLAAAAGNAELNERADEVRRICSDVQRAEQLDPANAPTHTAGHGSALPGVSVVPLSSGGNWSLANYVLHIEYRGAGLADLQAQERVVRHAVTALSHHTGGLAKAASTAGKSKLRLWLGLGLAAVGVLVAVPQELTISAGGELQPLQRQSLYVSESGVVEELLAADGGDVQRGDLLLRLRNDELLLEQQTLLGELAAVRARQAAVDAVRAGRSEGQLAGLAVGEQAELAARDESLRRQLEIVERRLSALELRAPQTGRVIGEELQERFFGRPVLRGQYFADVGDLQGSWELRLYVSEADIRHVLERSAGEFEANGDRPEVHFFLETNPDVSHSVRLGKISGVTEIDRRGSPVIAVTAEVPAGSLEGLRPGAGVRAVISCGRAPAGYVYFRRLIDVVMRQVLM